MMSGHRRLAEQVQAAARAFVEQSVQDPEFVTLYRADPVSVLRALGFPEIAIADALRETDYAEPEVIGFVAGFPSLNEHLSVDADPAILAECGFTCLWTTGSPRPPADGDGTDPSS